PITDGSVSWIDAEYENFGPGIASANTVAFTGGRWAAPTHAVNVVANRPDWAAGAVSSALPSSPQVMQNIILGARGDVWDQEVISASPYDLTRSLGSRSLVQLICSGGAPSTITLNAPQTNGSVGWDLLIWNTCGSGKTLTFGSNFSAKGPAPPNGFVHF